jgi:gliding motility-associated-like protein
LRDPAQAEQAWTDGVALQSPSPTRYMQLQIIFRGNGDVAPRIDNLTFLFAEEPAAQEVFGEIWPLETENFDPHTFTYVVRPLLQAGDKGFDRLEIFTQSRVQSVQSVLVDGVDMSERFPPDIQDDRIILAFDAMEAPRDNEKRIEVVFSTKVLRFGTEFTGWVYDSKEPALKQQIKPGNATFRFGGDVLSVRTPMGSNLISKVQLSSPVFTPNGDGINDRVEIRYDIRNVENLTQIAVNVFDLSGRLVRRVDETTTLSGSFELSWDGLDDQGAVVSPGIYMYQVELNTDGGSKVTAGVISVAY